MENNNIDENKKEILLSYFTTLSTEDQLKYITDGYKPVNKIKIVNIEYYEYTKIYDKDPMELTEISNSDFCYETVKYFKPYKLNNLEDFKKLIKKDDKKIDDILEHIFQDNILGYIYNNWDLEEIEKKKSTNKTPRKPLNNDVEYDEIGRCNAMVWGGGVGGRCKYKCVGNGLCKSHYGEVYEKKRLLGYGYYGVEGNGSVPDYDAQKFTVNKDNELEGNDEDIMKLRPLNIPLITAHKEYYNLNKDQFLEKYEDIVPKSQKDKFIKNVDIVYKNMVKVNDKEELIKEYNGLKSKKKLSKKNKERIEELENLIKE